MGNRLIAIDSWLIDHAFQPLSWRIERYTSLNNFQQSRAVICVAFAYSAVVFMQGPDPTRAAIVGGIAIYLLLVSFIRERQIKREALSAERLAMWWFRLSMIVCLLIGMSSIEPQQSRFSETLDNIAWTVVFYLFACDPMPPGFKRLRSHAKLRHA